MKLRKLNIALVICAGLAISFNANAQNEQRERKGPPSADKIIEKLDTDKDGKLSLEEVKADDRKRMADNFDKIDSDGDGYITKEELEAMQEKRKQKMNKE